MGPPAPLISSSIVGPMRTGNSRNPSVAGEMTASFPVPPFSIHSTLNQAISTLRLDPELLVAGQRAAGSGHRHESGSRSAGNRGLNREVAAFLVKETAVARPPAPLRA